MPGERNAPAFSISGRTRERKQDNAPAPGTYAMKSTLGGKGKGCSMGGRREKGGFADDTKKTPGPGTYSSSMSDKKTAPSFSMTARTYMPGGKSCPPSPVTQRCASGSAGQERSLW